MTDPATTTPPEPKPGRGPTRPAVKFADLVEDIQKRNNSDAITAVIKQGTTSKQVRENVKTLRAQIKAIEREIVGTEDLADILARVEELPAHLRAALVALVEAKS